MSARRKQSAVLRLLRGEDLELVSRELGVTAAELSAWRDAFLAAGEAALKTLMRKRLFPKDIYREDFFDASDKATGGVRSPLLKA